MDNSREYMSDGSLCVVGCLWGMETTGINGGNLWLWGSIGK